MGQLQPWDLYLVLSCAVRLPQMLLSDPTVAHVASGSAECAILESPISCPDFLPQHILSPLVRSDSRNRSWIQNHFGWTLMETVRIPFVQFVVLKFYCISTIF